MSGARDLLDLIDRRIARLLPPRPLGRTVGVVQTLTPSLRIAQVLLDGSTTPVSVAYPSLPTVLIVGDKVAVERSRDGWLMVTHVLGRPADSSGTFTPFPTFTTPGTMVWTPNTYFTAGTWWSIGGRVWVDVAVYGTLAKGSAAGTFQIGGLPFAVIDQLAPYPLAAASFQGWTAAGVANLSAFALAPNVLQVYASESASAGAFMDATWFGASVTLDFATSLSYVAA